MSESPEQKDYTPKEPEKLGGINTEGSFAFGLVGAGMGAVISWYLFMYLVQNYGMVAVVLPGALTGLGRAAMMKGKSWILGIVCGFFGLFIPIYIILVRTSHTMDSLSDLNKLGIFLGGAVGFYLGFGMLRR